MKIGTATTLKTYGSGCLKPSMAELHDIPAGSPGAQQPVVPPYSVKNGNLVNHRLDRLEERMTEVEKSIKNVELLCTEIKTNLENKASEKCLALKKLE